MKKLFYLILFLTFSNVAYAATIGDLVADTAPDGADVVEIEQSDASASNKATLANFSKGLTVTSMISACTDAQVLGGNAGGTGVECQADADTNTNASTICSGTTTYLDGEGNCDDIASAYKATVANAVTEVACAGSIADAITAATAGDTLILGSCSYSLSAALTIDKSLSIVGQGSNRTILAYGANVVAEGIAVDASNVLLKGFKMTGTAVTQAININDENAADVTGVDVEDVWIVTSLASGGMGALHYENASGQVENAILEITTGDMSGSNQQWGITAFYDADCGADHKVQVKNTYVKLISNDGTSVSGPQPIRPYMIWNNSSSICEYDHRLIVQDSAGIAYNATPADNDNNTNGINCQGANAARNYGTVGGTYCDVINSYIDGGSTHPSSSTGALDIRCDDYAECQLTDATLRRNSIQNINSGVITRLGVINASGLVISGGEQASPYIVGAASSLTGQQGGNDYLTGAAAGEAGAAISVTSGVGGSATAATTTGTGGASGAVALASNTGGAQDTATASANVGGASGAVTINTGDGGAATNGTVSNTGGAAGPVYIYGGVGGAGATAAGADGNVYLAVNAAGTRRGIVGIGTTSPLTGSTADIRTASGAILTISRNDTSISDTDSIGKIQWYGTDTNDADVYANIEVTAQGDTTSNAAGKMVFRTTATTAPVERMRISSAGLVGIGTSGPDKALELNIGTTDAFRLTYNDNNGSATNYVDYAVDSSGNPKITPSAGALTGFLSAASGVITATAANAGTDITADLEEEAHVAEHAENGADELTGESLGTACTENQILKANATGGLDCAADATGAGGGDEVSVDGSAVVNPNFASTGDIDFVDTSNTVTANLNADVVGTAEMADADHGDVSWSGGVATVDSGAVLLSELGDPAADKTFTMGDNELIFSYGGTNAASNFEIDITGASAGDALHVHQHTGNPTGGNLIHAESEDLSISPQVHIIQTAADLTSDVIGLQIEANDDNDTNFIPLKIVDDADGTPGTLLQVNSVGSITSAGDISLQGSDIYFGTATSTGDITFNGNNFEDQSTLNAASQSMQFNLAIANGSGTGGRFYFASGDGGATGAGGAFSAETGNGGGTSGNSGNFNVFIGTVTDGDAGDFVFTGRDGTGTNQDGSDFEIQLGAASGSGTAGLVKVLNGANVQTTLDFNSVATSTKTLTVPNETGTLCTTGSVCTGYQATVAEGTLADSTVVEADLKAVDAASDEDVLTYESTTGDFEWHSRDEIIGGISAGALPNDSILEADFKAVDAASDEECLTYETTTGDFEWQACGGGTDTNAVKEYVWPASATLPLEAADSIPPIGKDAGTNIDQLYVAFDDSTDECRSVNFQVPSDVTSGNVTFRVKWYSAAATTGAAMWDFRHNSGVAEGVDPDQSLTTESASSDATQGTAGQITVTAWTETIANLGWAASDQVDAVFCRDANGTGGTDDLSGDALATQFAVEIPRA